MRLYAGRVKLAQGLMLGDMKSLQELVIEATRKVIKEIGNLTELRTLRIVFNSVKTLELKESIQTSIQRLTNLQDLDLRNNNSFEEIIDMQQVPSGLQRLFMPNSHMKAFPCWINSSMLSRLTILSICLGFEYLQSDHLDRLAELPSLRFLGLQLAFVSEQLQEKLTIHRGACAFRSLKDFHFYSCMMPSFQPGAMPHLERLCLRIWARLRRGDLNDLGLENLHSLRHATIYSLGENTAVIEEALKDYPNQAALELLFW